MVIRLAGNLVIKIKVDNSTAYDGTEPDVMITLIGQGGTVDTAVLSLADAGFTADNFILA